MKNSLYDTYKMAIRWASDRIKEQGVIAFVTNGSWIDGNADAGVRACLAEEFSSIYVLHLRGNQRTQGELSKREGGKVFGSGSRAPVAISILVKNPHHNGCRIHYRDIGDYLSREAKLEALHDSRVISGFADWEAITPDKHHDWIAQRNEAFAQFYPLGTKDAKSGQADDSIFRLYSQGLKTGRDAYLYNFSHNTCALNGEKMTADYLAALKALEQIPELTEDAATLRNSSHIKWDRELKNNLKRRRNTGYAEDNIQHVLYRPFVKTNCYADYTFVQMKLQMDRIFPNSTLENRVIGVPGIGSKKPFSVLMTDTMPDYSFNDASQCFPRYRYLKRPDNGPSSGHEFNGIEEKPNCIDNICDTALNIFKTQYHDDTINKDAIFNYIYGVLHAPNYREEFANDLSKMLPRIPFAPNFYAFAEAGRALAKLHLGYETCEQHALKVVSVHNGEPQPHHFRLTEKAMRFSDEERTTLRINDHVSLSGIPAEAHRYVVNGRTPLEWYIDRYKIKTDKESGIVNDPNGWFADPRDLIAAIKRIVHVSVESTRIIEGLPREIMDVS